MLFKNTTRISPSRQRGIALIEVLISMLIMAIALRGIGENWVKTVQESEHNFSRSQALTVAQNIIEFVRVNPDGWNTYTQTNNWLTSNTIAPQNCFSPNASALNECTSEQIALSDIRLIKEYVAENMPLLNGSVELRTPCSASGNLACVVIAWMDTTTARCDPLSDRTGLFSAGQQDNVASQCVVIDFIP